MPYAGRRDGGLKELQGYVIGQENKRANEQAKVQQQIQKAYLSLAEDRVARENATAEYETWAGKKREYRADAEEARGKAAFEYEQVDRRKDAMLESHGVQQEEMLAGAVVQSGAAQAYKDVRADPRLAPTAKIHSAAMQKLIDQGADERTKAAFVRASLAQLGEQKFQFEEQDFDAALNDMLAQRASSSPEVAGDQKTDGVIEIVKEGGELWKASKGKQGLSPQQRLKLIQDSAKESAKNRGVAKARTVNAESLRTSWLTMVSPEKLEAAMGVIDAYEDPAGGVTYGQTLSALQKMVVPDVDDRTMNEFQRNDIRLRDKQAWLAENRQRKANGLPPLPDPSEGGGAAGNPVYGEPGAAGGGSGASSIPSAAQWQQGGGKRGTLNTPVTPKKSLGKASVSGAAQTPEMKATMYSVPNQVADDWRAAHPDATDEEFRSAMEKAAKNDPRQFATDWQAQHPGATKEEFKAAMKAAGF